MSKHQKYISPDGGRGFIMHDENTAKTKPFDKGEAGMKSFEYMHEEPFPRGFLKYYEYLAKLRR